MTCDLDIVIARKEQATSLPFSAIFQERVKEKTDEVTKEETKKTKKTKKVDDARTDEEFEYRDYIWIKTGTAWEKREVQLGLKGLKRVEILDGPSTDIEIYPDAERLSWVFKEHKHLAKQKGLLKEEEEKADPKAEEK